MCYFTDVIIPKQTLKFKHENQHEVTEDSLSDNIMC